MPACNVARTQEAAPAAAPASPRLGQQKMWSRSPTVRDLRVELRLKVGDAQHLYDLPVGIREFVQRILDLAVREDHDRVLVAAASDDDATLSDLGNWRSI